MNRPRITSWLSQAAFSVPDVAAPARHLLEHQQAPQTLAAETTLTGKREHIYHAAMVDPHTGAELDLDQIWSLVDDLLEAHAEILPEYAPA